MSRSCARASFFKLTSVITWAKRWVLIGHAVSGLHFKLYKRKCGLVEKSFAAQESKRFLNQIARAQVNSTMLKCILIFLFFSLVSILSNQPLVQYHNVNHRFFFFISLS